MLVVEKQIKESIIYFRVYHRHASRFVVLTFKRLVASLELAVMWFHFHVKGEKQFAFYQKLPY